MDLQVLKLILILCGRWFQKFNFNPLLWFLTIRSNFEENILAILTRPAVIKILDTSLDHLPKRGQKNNIFRKLVITSQIVSKFKIKNFLVS